MDEVYIVEHVHDLGDDREDYKLIGVFDSKERAEEAIEILKNQPGFCDMPEGFYSQKHKINKINWTEGFVTV